MKSIRCFSVPAACDRTSIGPNAVVIDVLRASTTICHALFHGARCIRPFPEVELAAAFARENSNVLTGGERQGEKLPGFDLGNSPLEYSREKVSGLTVAFTTTNGTRAMEKCKSAAQVVVGAFCNLSTTVDYFRDQDKLDLVCAGTNGELSTEDCAFAGAVVEQLIDSGDCSLNSDAEICLEYWRQGNIDLPAFLRTGIGGKNLLRLGRDKDIDFAARIDSLPLTPRLNVAEWKIEPA